MIDELMCSSYACYDCNSQDGIICELLVGLRDVNGDFRNQSCICHTRIS